MGSTYVLKTNLSRMTNTQRELRALTVDRPGFIAAMAMATLGSLLITVTWLFGYHPQYSMPMVFPVLFLIICPLSIYARVRTVREDFRELSHTAQITYLINHRGPLLWVATNFFAPNDSLIGPPAYLIGMATYRRRFWATVLPRLPLSAFLVLATMAGIVGGFGMFMNWSWATPPFVMALFLGGSFGLGLNLAVSRFQFNQLNHYEHATYLNRYHRRWGWLMNR